MVHRLDRRRGQTQCRQALMRRLDVCHRHRQMAIAVAMAVRLGLTLVVRQFEFETTLVIGKVGEGKTVEGK